MGVHGNCISILNKTQKGNNNNKKIPNKQHPTLNFTYDFLSCTVSLYYFWCYVLAVRAPHCLPVALASPG